MRPASTMAAALAFLALVWPRMRPEESSATNPRVEDAPTAPAPVVATAPPPPAHAAVAASRELLLPDGSTVPALNGAVDPAPLLQYWGPFPWSPIVGRERSSAGIEWYRHADGSYSTTEMVFVAQLGKQIALTRVAHPGPEQPPNTPPDRR